MRKSVEDYYKIQNRQFKLWLSLIILSPICLGAFWVIYFSLLALYRALHNSHFGHGSEILVVLPIALVVVLIQIRLLKNLIESYKAKKL
ncbi:hypothetical protein R50072_23240 [Simiduia litorea]